LLPNPKTWLQLANGLAELLPPDTSAADALRIADTYVKVPAAGYM
jgi:hypothetical protein